MLHGRTAEQDAVERALADARSGRGHALVVRGGAGIGKTALLDHARQAAADMRIARTTGIESEAELSFAALHSLVRPFAGHFDALPGIQAAPLRGIAGMAPPVEMNPFMIGGALLSLLAEAAATGPVLCLIDDLQWFDRASADALCFAARRLEAEGVAMLLAARDDPSVETGLPEHRLQELDAQAAVQLLRQTCTLSSNDRQRVVDEAHGNPLALLELSRALADHHDLSEYGLPSPMRVSGRVEAMFSEQIRSLPANTRTLLLVGAAAGSSNLVVVLEAAKRLGASADDFGPAEAAGLVSVTPATVDFRHPLVRSAVYQTAPFAQRMATHRALAEVLTSDYDADRRAWHLAASVTGPDDRIADELERAATRAGETGGHAAVCAAYQRAAELTTAQPQRAYRQGKAAIAATIIGERDRAVELAERSLPAVTDPDLAADLAITLFLQRWESDPRAAMAWFCDVVLELAPQTPAAAERPLSWAITNLLIAADAGTSREMAARLAGLELPDSPELYAMTRAIAGLRSLVSGYYDSAVADLSGLAGWLLDPDSSAGLMERAERLTTAHLIGDLRGTLAATTTVAERCRTEGAFSLRPYAGAQVAQAQFWAGLHREAELSGLEALHLAGELGPHASPLHINGILADVYAARGDEVRCRDLTSEAFANGLPAGKAAAACALAVLDLGHGRPAVALHRLEQAGSGSFRHVRRVLYALPTLVEAAALAGEPERGLEACGTFSRWAEATGRTWANSIALRCHALLAPDDEAGGLYERAVRLGQPDGSSFEQARTELLYGTWLRRHRRVLDARAILRPALEAFECAGATVWADRARTELRAAGETAEPTGRPDPDLLELLTPQELQVVRSAAQGMTNRQIAERLYISPRTVEYHLYKAYPKLDVASRFELTRFASSMAAHGTELGGGF